MIPWFSPETTLPFKVKSKLIGASAVFYPLFPALLCWENSIAVRFGLLQGAACFLSDFYACGEVSWLHAFDRICATFGVFATFCAAVNWGLTHESIHRWYHQGLAVNFMLLLLGIALFLLFGAKKKAKRCDLDGWIQWHCAWHLWTGLILGIVGSLYVNHPEWHQTVRW